MKLLGIWGLMCLLIGIYCALDPFKHSAISGIPDFVPHLVEMSPWSELPVEEDSENLLQNSEVKFLNQIHGPESIAFDPQGRGPYTGLADGRIVFWNGQKIINFAYTSPNRSSVCDPKTSVFSYMENEHICGRPLGLRFDKKTGDLYIADAYFGLMKVGPEGGLATSLTTEAEGIPFRFTNDLDIDDEGQIYFADSSTKYQRRSFLQLIFSSEDSGRILKYDIRTKETSVLVRNLQFPNGVSLSKDRSFLVFCEGPLGRLSKYWLKGDKKGTSEVMAILPGFPDNVRTNEKGEFWVGIHSRRSMYAYYTSWYPKFRLFILKLPVSAKIHHLFQIGGHPHAVIVKYSPEGKLLKILEDKSGKVVHSVSEAHERDGKIWIGSVLMSCIVVYELND